jgi:ribosome-associated heat shock protein Hsp15
MADEARSQAPPDTQAVPTQRLDKWLWFARVTKSRTLAAQLVHEGKVRVNRTRVAKSSQAVRAGDVLTIAVRGQILLLKVMQTGERRGPPAAARQLYEPLALDSITGRQSGGTAERGSGAGRPTKRDRRMIDRLWDRE